MTVTASRSYDLAPSSPLPALTTSSIDLPAKMDSDPYKSGWDKGFSQNDIKVLMKYKLPRPSLVLEAIKNGQVDYEYYKNVLVK